MIDHQRARVLGATALDFDLSAAQKASLEEHVRGCVSCRADIVTMRAHDGALRALPRRDAPAAVRMAVVAAASTPRWAVRRQPTLSPGFAALALLIAALLAAVIVSTGTRLPLPAPSPTPSAGAQPTPVPTPPAAGILTATIRTSEVAPETSFCSTGGPAGGFNEGGEDCAIGIDYFDGSIWATQGLSIVRVDTATNAITTSIPLPSDPRRIVTAAGWIWATMEDGGLAKVDPRSNSLIATFGVGTRLSGLWHADGDLWAADLASNQVVRVDPATGRVRARVEIGGRPWGLASTPGVLWVTSQERKTLSRIDMTTNRVVGTVDLSMTQPADVVAAGDAVWVVGSGGDLVKIDPLTAQIELRSLVPTVASLALDGSTPWVASSVTRIIDRIDPATGQIAASLTLPEAVRSDNLLSATAVGDGSIWMAIYNPASSEQAGLPFLFRIDPGASAPSAAPAATAPATPAPSATPAAGTITAVITTTKPAVEPDLCGTHGGDQCPIGLAEVAGAIWVNQGQSIARVNPATNQIVATVALDSDPNQIVSANGYVWVALANGRLARIDPRTNATTGTYRVGTELSALAASGTDIWAVDIAKADLAHVDARSGSVVARVHLGGIPTGVAATPTAAWVANRTAGTASRIDADTDRIVATVDLSDFEPSYVAASSDAIWVVGHGDVARIDATTNTLTDRALVHTLPSLALDGSTPWATSAWNRTLDRIDPTTLETLGTALPPEVGQGNQMTATIVAEGSVWIAIYDESAAQQTGVPLLFRIDPAS